MDYNETGENFKLVAAIYVSEFIFVKIYYQCYYNVSFISVSFFSEV